jgi:hypothetical protein
MANDDDSLHLERRLIAELADLEGKIGSLVAERESIRRILMRVRQETKINVDVTRKNSINRIVIEDRITEVLKNSARPLSTKRLASEAKSVVYNLKDNTFRSHLSRMKARGLIVGRGTSLWTLPPPADKG